MIRHELRVMRGPNMWSDTVSKLIILKFDFSSLEKHIAQKMLGQFEKYLSHTGSSISKNNDSFLELTTYISLIGKLIQPHSEKLYSEARLVGERSYYAIFSYEEENVATKAAEIVLNITDSFLKNEEPVTFSEARQKLTSFYEKNKFGPSTSAIIEAAKKRNIPVRTNAGGIITFGQGKHQKRISASICETTSNISVEIAGNKDITKKLLEAGRIPVPKGIVITKETSLEDVVTELGFPLVAKPLNGNQGKGITTDINDPQTLVAAFKLAKEFSHSVIIEKFITGFDYRFLVVGYKLIAVAKRTPASVIGDGVSSIKQLIDMVNEDPSRGDGHENILSKIKLDDCTKRILAKKELTTESILEKGTTLFLKDTANLSTGGTAEDMTDEIHPENKMLIERAAKIIGLDICGIDVTSPDVKSSILTNGGAILEVNAAPGLRMHLSPSLGKPRNVGDPIVDLMFPENETGRIPIVAITGTNGKTTTSRLMSYITAMQGHQVGFTTTDGVYLNNTQIEEGDCTGSKSAGLILQDPSVDFAVLECARGGIIRSGLGFDACDIGIVTNVAEDHLGLKDIYTIQDLAKVKSVIPKSVKASGYAILNAANDLVYEMKEGLSCKTAFFCIDHKNPRIKDHCKNGGLAAAVNEKKEIIIIDGNKEIVIDHIENIPLTINGKAEFMIENILPVVLSSYILNFSIEKVQNALRTFKPSAEMTPGRLNLFKINGVNLLIDYAHNPHGLKALGNMLKKIPQHKIGIITGVGDRRDDDIIEVGRIAAEMYDEVIIRIDDDTRGRPGDQILELLKKGVKETNPQIKCHYIPDGKEALLYAIENSSAEGYVIISVDHVTETLEFAKQLEAKYN